MNKDKTPKKSPKRKVKNYELNPSDLANIEGRLKVIDYMSAIIKKDCYDYIREVVFKRLNLPKDWAIIHNPQWTVITVISPSEETEFKLGKTFEDHEVGLK